MNDDQHTEMAEQAISPQGGAAERALAEAERRRAERDRTAQPLPREIDGREGPEPIRYGDWESKGIAYDF